MISTVLTAIAFFSSAQDPIDLLLAWKKGDRINYTVGVKSPFGTAEGLLELTVANADEKGFKLSWPEVVFSGGMRPHAAGSVDMDKRGRLVGKEKMPDACMYLVQMSLPDKAISVGGQFKVSYAFGDSKMDLSGKLEKIEDSKGKVAHLVYDGTLRTPDGGSMQIKQRSVFDMSRGVFRSSEMEMVQQKTQFTFKLPESKQ